MDTNPAPAQPISELFLRLLEILQRLRGPQGCPWDRQQTHDSLIRCLLEECYEAISAIESGDPEALCEELGDVLLQVVFHAQIATEASRFGMSEILTSLLDKLTRRHPNVFGGPALDRPEEALAQWEKIKASEKESGSSRLSGIPNALPALLRAYRLGSKASKSGLDWATPEAVWAKVGEELSELQHAWQQGSQCEIEEEIGDLLFTLAQLSRFGHVDPEEALRKSGLKFQRRFERIEQILVSEGKTFEDCSPDELDSLWQQAKSK